LRHCSSERVADDVDRILVERVEQVGDDLGQRRDRVGSARCGGPAGPRSVEADDAEVGEIVVQRLPEGDAGAEAVDQEDGRAVTAHGDAEAIA
jgi:hypothetical protein